MVKPIYLIKFRKIKDLLNIHRWNKTIIYIMGTCMRATESKVVITLVFTIFLTACNSDWVTNNWNISPIKTEPEYLRHPNGQRVLQCDGSGIPLRNGAPERFWERNNLPKGTTEFVCVDGKAYLQGKEPQK